MTNPLDLPFDTEEMLTGLRPWIETESPTFDGAAVNRMMDVVQHDLAILGARTERIPSPMGLGDSLRVELKRKLASYLLELSRRCDAALIAEGIETREDLEILRDLGVDFGQGYLYGRADVPGGRDDWEADTLPDPAPRASGQGGV